MSEKELCRILNESMARFAINAKIVSFAIEEHKLIAKISTGIKITVTMEHVQFTNEAA